MKLVGATVFLATQASAGPPAPAAAPAPWDITYQELRANFTNTSTIEIDYLVNSNREHRGQLLQKGCKDPVDTTLYSMTNSTTSFDDTHDKLTVVHDFNITKLATSNIWNSSTSKLQVCQKVNLVAFDQNDQLMEIVENVMEVEVDFDLEATFTTTEDLKNGVVYNETEEVDFRNDVTAYKCDGFSGGDPFGVNQAFLAPNQELAVCITSKDENVNIASLTAMSINQDVPEQVTVAVVANNNIEVAAITFVSDPTSQGIYAVTRVPLDRFSFETGNNITISGDVKLELVGTVERKLRALVEEDGVIAAGPEEVGYALTVSLQSEVDGAGEDQVKIGSSDGHAIMDNGLAILSLVIVTLTCLVV